MVSSATVSNELKRLFHQSTHYLAGLVGSLAIGFIAFPLYTRIFSVADYGTIDFVQKIVLLFTAVAKMGQQNSVLRFYDGPRFAADPAAARRYYSTMFFGMAATGATISLVFGIGMKMLPRSMADAAILSLVVLAAVLVFLRTIGSVLLAFIRIEERTIDFAVISVIVKAAAVAIICSLILIAGSSGKTFFTGNVVVESVAGIVLVALLVRRGLVSLWSFDVQLFRAALAFGGPLIVYEMATIILDSGDRVLIRSYLGAEALGRYSVAYGLAAYVNDLLIAPLNLALLPIYMRLWSTEGRDKTAEFLSFGANLYVLAAAGILAVLAATARGVVTILASSKYEGVDSLIPLIVSGLLTYTMHVFFAAGLLIHKKTILMAKVLVFSAAVNLVLNCFLLPRIGLQGGAVATLLSYVACVALLTRYSSQFLPLRIDWRAAAQCGAAALLAWLAGSQISFSSHVLTVAARGSTVGVLYIGLLYGVDQRIRLICRHLVRAGVNRLSVSPSL